MSCTLPSLILVGVHNEMTFGASYNFIGKMGGWELRACLNLEYRTRRSLEKLIFCSLFYVYCCEGVFFHGEKSNVAKHLITYRILS